MNQSILTVDLGELLGAVDDVFLFPNPKNSMYVHRVECFFELYSYIVLLSSTNEHLKHLFLASLCDLFGMVK